MQTVVDFREDVPDVLGFPVDPLPIIPHQKRKRQAKNSMPEWKIMGADTETVEGRVWLFSSEVGVWEVESLGTLLAALYDPLHANKWKSGRGDGRKAKRGISTREFFFYNLKFDCQAFLRLLDDESVLHLIAGDKVELTAQVPNHGEVKVRMKYLEGKHFSITPIDWHIGQYKVGACYMWDIMQFYPYGGLNAAAKAVLGEHKIERCFDNSILDASRFDEEEYRDFYREDIEKYAIHDAYLAGELARVKRREFISQDVRFIRPYSLANVAQRNMLDICKIPTVNTFTQNPVLLDLLAKANTAYTGGWFEARGSGFMPNCTHLDLASAYPYVMYHLADIEEGEWVRGDEQVGWWNWCESRRPFSLGFAEAFVVFEPGLPWNPLVKKAPTGTLTAPRITRGWFTAEELIEARKWPHTQFIIGEWFYHAEGDRRPFEPFIKRFYDIKMSMPKGTVAYDVSKVIINSAYGKVRQAVDGKAGKLWNPFYASTICGATRARLAELIRLNDFTAVSVATDGVIFPTDDLHTIPNRPLPAPHNLGQWELDGEGDLLVVMSGVYSMQMGDFVKTVYRGSAASLALRGYREGGLFRFCEEHSEERHKIATTVRPYSAKEARMKGDLSLMNRFEERRYTFRALGDSTKRAWLNVVPRVFGDLLQRWWVSTPHRQVHGLWVDSPDYDPLD